MSIQCESEYSILGQAAYSLLPTLNYSYEHVLCVCGDLEPCLHHDWWVLLHSPTPVMSLPHLVPAQASLCCVPPTV